MPSARTGPRQGGEPSTASTPVVETDAPKHRSESRRSWAHAQLRLSRSASGLRDRDQGHQLTPRETYAAAALVGIANTLLVSALAIITVTIVGFAAGRHAAVVML